MRPSNKVCVCHLCKTKHSVLVELINTPGKVKKDGFYYPAVICRDCKCVRSEDEGDLQQSHEFKRNKNR